MNFATKFSLGVVGLGALVGVWYADEYYTKKETEEKKVSGKPLSFETEKVRTVTLTSGSNTSGAAGETFVFTRESTTTPWKFGGTRAEGKTKPDQDAVNNLLSALDTLSLENELEGTESSAKLTANDANFGFNSPRAKLEISLEGGKTETFVLGNDLSIGASTGGAISNALSVYALSTTKNKVLVVGSSIVSATKKGFGDFRSKIAGDFTVADVKTISLTKTDGTNIEVTKGEKDWAVVKPQAMPADNNNIGLYMDKFAKLRVENINEPEMLTPELKKTLALDAPAGTVEFKNAEGKVLQKFEMSITKDATWVTMSDGAAGKVDFSQYADLAPTLKYFRDRKVMRDVAFNDIVKLKTKSGRTFQKEGGNWYFVSGTGSAATEAASAKPTEKSADKPTEKTAEKSPEKVSEKDAADVYSQWEFLTADDILDNPATGVTPSTAGLDKPISKFVFEFTAESKKAPIEVLIGNRVPKNEKNVYVKRSDKAEIYAVESQWTDALARLDGTAPKAADPQAAEGAAKTAAEGAAKTAAEGATAKTADAETKK